MLRGDSVPSFKHDRVTPAQIIILGFLLLIFTGAVLLMLPFSTQEPGGASFGDALFTATSATCVTGLVLHDTALYWSPFGQLVILLLIQVGGMGVVTIAVAIFMFAGKRIGLKQRWVMQESISAPQVGGIVRMTGFILKTAFLIEGIGALLLALRFCPQFGLGRGLWYAVFHSVSAFCNAGFDLMGVNSPFSSLTDYVGDPLVSNVIAFLIIIGGVGFLTWNDIREHKLHFRRYRLQSKLILTTTLALILTGLLFFLLYEFEQGQWVDMSLWERINAAFFQSVTPRTAGFNTVDLTGLSQPAQLGIRAVFRHKERPQCFGRRIADESIRNASAIFLLYLLLFLTGGILICCIDGVPLMAALFEAASAIGTVGLSLGITPELSGASRLILIFLMYFGRVGGLTMIYAVTAKGAPELSQFPQERVTIG